MSGRIEVRIGRLTVIGTSASPAALRRSLEQEIAAILRAPGARDRLRQGGSVERLTAPLGWKRPATARSAAASPAPRSEP